MVAWCQTAAAGDPGPLPIDSVLYAPTFRLQDELHLLRDSLGAVDAHYECVLDGIQEELTGSRPKKSLLRPQPCLAMKSK